MIPDSLHRRIGRSKTRCKELDLDPAAAGKGLECSTALIVRSTSLFRGDVVEQYSGNWAVYPTRDPLVSETVTSTPVSSYEFTAPATTLGAAK